MPVHFEDRSGTEFERLCFAYLLRAFDWKSIDWYGQLGGDGGRDIWAVRRSGDAECFQCANYRALKFQKAKDDLAKLVAGPNGLPIRFTLITGGKVSAEMKEKVVAHALKIGIREAEVWSGPEFEERLRRDEPLLLRRFAEGVPFPETVDNGSLGEPVFFAGIQPSPGSLWRTAHRLHKLPRRGRLRLDFGFHEMQEREWHDHEGRGIDPILDVVLKNDGDRSVVVGAVGLVLLDKWTDLKGLLLSEPIPVQEGVILKLKRLSLGRRQMQALVEPRALPGNGGVFRFKLTLRGFRAALCGKNEAIIQLVADVDGAQLASRQFYMGIY